MLQPFQSQLLSANSGQESPTISSQQPSRQASTPSSRRPSITSSLPPSPTIVGAYERFHTAIGSAIDAMVSTESTVTTTYGVTGSIQPPIPPPSPPSSPPLVQLKPSSTDRNEIINQSTLDDDNNENNNNSNSNNNHHQHPHQHPHQHHNPELSNDELRRRFSESIHQQNQRSPSFHLGTPLRPRPYPINKLTLTLTEP